MVGLPEITVTVVLLDVDHVVVQLFFQAQAKLGNALGNDDGPPDQGGAGQALVHHDLTGAQHALFFSLGIGNPLFDGFFGRCKNGLHHGARGVDKALQALAVGVHVLNRTQSDATVCCGLGHSRRDLHHQAGIERLGNDVFRTKRQLLTGIGGGDHFALFRLRKFRNGVHGCNFHLQRDGGGACVQRAPENVREAQDIVDLVRVVSATGGDDGVAAHRLDIGGVDFGVGVGQRKHQGPWRHFGDHVFFEHATSREAQKHVSAFDDLAQGARAGGLGVDDLVLVHQLGAALVDHTSQVGDIDVFARNAQFHQQAQASQCRGASP